MFVQVTSISFAVKPIFYIKGLFSKRLQKPCIVQCTVIEINLFETCETYNIDTDF